MEPQGPPHSPGTSNGSRPLDSAQDQATPTSPNCTLQPSYSPTVSDGLMSAKDSGYIEDESFKQVQASQSTTGPDRRAHRRFSSSAFASSLSWDSDSEKEALDEEDLQHFSNPHGLAAHSPGSPSSGHRHESEEDQNPEKLQCLHIKTESLVPMEGNSADNESAKKEEPNTSQADSTELPEDKVWNVSEEAKTFLAKIKQKDGCQMEAGPEPSETVKQLDRDVYSFPGDSDPESPPDTPWARSTSIQRCRKSKVLLRPFCGLGSSTQTAAECEATMSPRTLKPAESVMHSKDEGSCEFESIGEGAAEKATAFLEQGGFADTEDDGQSEQEAERDIFTCVECSIYFKKQSHLQEHIAEHCESSTEGSKNSVKGSYYRCVECGWGLPNQLALEDHLRRHQESRLKILEEIKKLNANSRASEPSLEMPVVLDGSAASTSDKEADHSFETPSSLSPARGSSEGTASMATDSNKASSSVQCPAHVRGGASNRRRFWCTKCTFTTRTSQALANHAKTHNRKKNMLPKNESNSPRPSSSRSTSASLACFHCAFRTSSQTLMREHQKHLHPGQFFISGWQADEIGQHSKSRVSKPNLDSELPSGSGSVSVSQSKTTPDKCQHRAPACEESGIPDCAAALPVGQVFKSSASRKFSVRRKSWTRLDHENLLGILEHDEVSSPELVSESSQKEAKSPVGPEAGLHETPDDWPEEETAKSLLTPERTLDNKDKPNSVEKDRKVFFLRSRNRSAACPVEVDGDDNDDDTDEDNLQHFLTESLLDGDGENAEDDVEAFKSMEKKCPYCPDRFHNGIGLANHVRGHLNRVGVSYNVRHFISPKEVNEIERKFSYQKKKKKARHLKCAGKASSPSGEPCRVHSTPSPLPLKDEYLEEDMDVDRKPSPIPPTLLTLSSPSSSPGASPTATSPHPGSPLSVVRKAPISSLLPVSSLLRSQEHKVGLVKSSTLNHSQAPGAITNTKPLWAPQENDAPLNLTLEVDPNKDIVCQLCGAWFETRKGLSSHARAHLRHFGVEYSESKGSPIDLLDQLVSTDDFKHKASEMLSDGHLQLQQQQQSSPSLLNLSKSSRSSPSPASLIYTVTKAASKATSTTTSSVLGPPPKRHKSSSMRVFRLSSGELMALHNEPPKEIGCEFCGEYFENRKGLSSHARSHLRQMGITEWSVNGSPIDTLREVITRRGLPCALPRKPLKSPPPSSPGPPRSPLPTSSSPSSALLSRPPFAFVHPSSPPPPPQLASSKSNSIPLTSPGGLILKLKPEPAQLEVTAPETVGRADEFSGDTISWANADSIFPLNLAIAHETEPTRDIRCEFCGEYFENRKGLSSHARSHLRQMGITEWSVNGSPIDTLREVMHKRGLEPSPDQGVKKESSQDPNSPSWESTGEPGCVEGGVVTSYQTTKFSKPPLALLQSGPRLHKQGLTSLSAHAVSSTGKFFRISPLGKRPQQFDEARSKGSERPPPPRQQPRTFSPQLHDFSFKRKASPDKHGHRDPSCELCGFFFENRKALASHARAHLRQFGVTEWSVNGSPIETLSAWMRSRPQKVLEMHRSYMQGNRSSFKKKDSPSTLSSTSSSSSSSSRWSSSLALSLVRPQSREIIHGSSSKSVQGNTGTNLASPPANPRCRSPSLSRLVVAGGGGRVGEGGDGLLPLQAQVARSELNVRLPRGFERRPLKHPSCPDGAERDSGPPKPPRTGTIPALVPKPPAAPLVKLVGKFYTLKCRFCEVQFHGPLSVQEDWIRHLQQHILKMNFSKAAAPPPGAEDPAPSGGGSAQASTSTSSSVPAAAAPSSANGAPCSSPSTPAERPLSAKVSEASPAPVTLCTQTL